jgi:hypothetical protein
MSAVRTLGIVTSLLVLTACSRPPAATGPAPLVPQDGPDGHIYASYSGGLFNRTAEATFKVDKDAYVLVGHLGGDGVIRVLFPEDGRETGRVRGGKYFRTSSFPAVYDASPGLYNMTFPSYRNLSARYDSYDGRGHGYLFMITSERPLRFDAVSDFGIWDDFEITNYSYSTDPRRYVRSFADMIGDGAPLSIEYAKSMRSNATYSYADAMYDCALADMYGSAMYTSLLFYYSPFSSPINFYGLGNGYGCGFNSQRQLYRMAFWRSPLHRRPTSTVGVIPTPSTPSSPAALTPLLGRRGPWAAGPAVSLTRPSTARTRPTGTFSQPLPASSARSPRWTSPRAGSWTSGSSMSSRQSGRQPEAYRASSARNSSGGTARSSGSAASSGSRAASSSSRPAATSAGKASSSGSSSKPTAAKSKGS